MWMKWLQATVVTLGSDGDTLLSLQDLTKFQSDGGFTLDEL